MLTLKAALEEATAAVGRIDAQVLFAHMLGVNRAYLAANPMRVLTESEDARADMMVAQRSMGLPVAYLLGKREFYSRDFAVGPNWPAPRNIAGIDPKKRGKDWVECTIFGPRVVAPAKRALIQAFVHRPSKAGEAQSLAKEFDREGERLRVKGLGAPIPVGTKLTFTLDAPELDVRRPV